MAEIYGFAINVEGNSVKSITAINQSLEGLSNNASKSSGSIAGGFIKANIAMAAFNTAVAGMKAIYNLGVQTEQTRIAFDTMLGSAEKGSQMFNALKKWADVTPFDNDTAYQAGKLLLNYGVAAKDVVPYMSMLGDASGGVKERFDRMAYAFGQIKSAGKLQGQDLRQLIDAGFNPLQQISESTGVSMSKLKKDMEAGNITFEKVVSAFKMATQEGGRFHGMMKNQSETVGGLWLTLEGTAQTAAYGIFQAFSPTLKNLYKQGIEVAQAFADWITPKYSEQLEQQKSSMNGMFEVLKQSNIPLNMRKDLIGEINSKYGSYLSNLLTEKSSLKDIANAQYEANKQMGEKISFEANKEMFDETTKAVSKTYNAYKDMAVWLERKKSGEKIEWWSGLVGGTSDIRRWALTKGYIGNVDEQTNKQVIDKYGDEYIKDLRLAYENAKLTSDRKKLDIYKKGMGEIFTAPTFGTSSTPTAAFSQNASATSDMARAGGGLGEAKVINISIDKMMQVNASTYSGEDIKSDAVKTVEEMTRMIKNVSYGQGLMSWIFI